MLDRFFEDLVAPIFCWHFSTKTGREHCWMLVRVHGSGYSNAVYTRTQLHV